MSISLLGKAWVTNHGCDEKAVCEAILHGKPPRLSEITNPFTDTLHHVALVAKEDYAEAESFRRVRRSSTITLLALTAAMRAIRDAKVEWNADIARRTVLLFVSSDGGVAYTRRFYSDIVANGASGASPILFPETVYNAPASHLCAYFGIEGEALTLVGGAGIGGSVIHQAAEILASGSADYCLAVAAEEMDWILCEAYSCWGATRDSREKDKSSSLPGASFAEGAGALLFAREGSSMICKTHPGFIFQHPTEAPERFAETCLSLTTGTPVDAFLSAANGTGIDAIETECLRQHFPSASVYKIKETLGEALAASSFHQMVFAATLLQNPTANIRGVLISTLGFSGQAGAVLLTPSERKG